MKYITLLYNSFLWSLVISVTAFTSEWLEMRVNIGTVLFGIWLLLFIILSFISRKKTFKNSFIFTLVNLVICFIYGVILYGIERIGIVPGSIIREGLHMTSIKFSSINIALCILLLIGLVAIFITSNKKLIK